MLWDAEHAAKILDTFDDCYFLKHVSGKATLKKTHRYKIGLGAKGKHIVVTRERNEGAITAYVNFRSLSGNAFQHGAIPGEEVTQEYFPGHVGATGDHGIAASVAALETLNPKENHVLRLDIDGPSAFKVLVNWYAACATSRKRYDQERRVFNHDPALANDFQMAHLLKKFLSEQTKGRAFSWEHRDVK